MSDMVKLGGLWLNEDKNGQKYFSGSFGNAKILIFKNTYKEEDKHPDYNIFIAAKPKPEEGDAAPAPARRQENAAVAPTDDDVPF